MSATLDEHGDNGDLINGPNENKKNAFRGVMWSKKDQYAQTPKEVLMPLIEEWGILNDVCPAEPQRDNLAEQAEWEKVSYCNPPYSAMDAWVNKIIQQWRKEKTIVLLCPARTNTNWWHDYIIPFASEIRFVRQGIKFKGYKKKSPFPTALVIFKAEDAKFADKHVETKVSGVDFYEKKKKRKLSK